MRPSIPREQPPGDETFLYPAEGHAGVEFARLGHLLRLLGAVKDDVVVLCGLLGRVAEYCNALDAGGTHAEDDARDHAFRFACPIVVRISLCNQMSTRSRAVGTIDTYSSVRLRQWDEVR